LRILLKISFYILLPPTTIKKRERTSGEIAAVSLELSQNLRPLAPAALNASLRQLLETSKEIYAGSCKKPDASIFPGLNSQKKPTICLEVGYTETYQELLQDTELLLESTSGKIGRVILIKLDPLAKGDTEIKNGFAEVWKYDASTGRMKMDLFPNGGSRQRLVFSWHDLLSEKMDECHIGSARSPPALKIDLLRAQEKAEEEGQDGCRRL